MTTYADVTGTAAYNRAKFKPHDKNRIRMAKIEHNFSATSVAGDEVVNCITIPANSIVIGAWGKMTTDSSLADAHLDLQYGATGAAYASNADTNSTTMLVAASAQNVEFKKTANIITIEASNGVNDVNAGVVEIICAYIELDSLGAAG